MEADITSQAVGLASNTDFSILKLFIRADIIVKSVIIILIASADNNDTHISLSPTIFN